MKITKILLGLLLFSSANADSLVMPDGFGGESIEFQQAHSPSNTTNDVQALLGNNALATRSIQSRLFNTRANEPIKLEWPIKAAEWLTDFHTYGFSNFVDHDRINPNSLLDYYCGDRTYDVSGYNHKGTDIFVWPFPWNKMADDAVTVIAAAPGKIIKRIDGNDDDSCTYTGKLWNAVYIEHADGSVAIYAHFKKDSITEKSVGDFVDTGEYLGVVGSSGNSSIPHLHLELYDAQGQLIDPNAGSCNSMNAESWWVNQPEYYETAVNRLTVGSLKPILKTCPKPDVPNEKLTLTAGDTAYFTSYLHGQRDVNQAQYRIRKSNGTVQSSWGQSSTQSLYNASYWYWYFNNFASSGPFGVWSFETDYDGQTYAHQFNVIPSCSNGVNPNLDVSLDLEGFCEQPIPTFSLASNKWYQISIPANPGAAERVVDIMPEALRPQTYGKEWILYAFDPEAGQYQRSGIGDALIPGKAYWIIQTIGENVQLSMTDMIPNPRGNAEITMAGNDQVRWYMIGFPRRTSVEWDSVRVKLEAGSGPCATGQGCDLQTAQEENLIYSIAWAFDGDDYQLLNSGTSVNAWTGFWVAVLPAANGKNLHFTFP